MTFDSGIVIYGKSGKTAIFPMAAVSFISLIQFKDMAAAGGQWNGRAPFNIPTCQAGV